MMVFGLAMVASTPLRAQTAWTGTDSSSWFEDNNWTPPNIPDNSTDVIINTVTPNPVVDGAAAQAKDLRVGDSASGMLTIRNGGTVSATTGRIGEDASATGRATVDGPGSSWSNTFFFIVGNGGAGTLTIQNRGNVSNGLGVIGDDPDSTGTVTVDGPGSSWTNNSSLVVGDLGAGTLTIRNGGTVSNPSGFVAVLPGSTGTVTVDGPGSSWTGSGEIVVGNQSAGTLTIRNGGTVSSMTGSVGFFDTSTGTATVDGPSSSWTTSDEFHVGRSGTGTLTIRNGGTVSASSVSVAQNLGSAGTLNIGAASGQPAAAPGIVNTPTVAFGTGTGSMAFNHTAANYVFAPTISGVGSVGVEAGTTILTASNTYTGATTVNGGTLLVNGSIAPSGGLTVNPGATVGGIGTLSSTTIAGGILSPGNSIGTISVAGNLVLDAATTYLVEIAGAAADRTNVNGTATLNGTVRATLLPGSSLAKRRYTILSAAGGLGGTRFTGASLTNFLANLSYDANNVFLDLTAALGLGGGLPRNPQGVANVINSFFNSGGTLPASFVPLFGLTGQDLANALSTLKGEVATSTQSAAFRSMDLFLQMMLDPFAVGRSNYADGPALAFSAKRAPGTALAPKFPIKEPPPPPTFEKRWTAWGGVYGGRQSRDGDTSIGSHALRTNVWGLAAGADWRLQDSVLGVALSAGTTSFDLATGLGSGDTNFAQLGLYGSTRIGAAYASAAFAYGWHQAEHERSIAFAGPETLKGQFDGHQFGGRIEAGWRQATPWLLVTPYAAVTAQQFHSPGYGETASAGSADFALNYAGDTSQSVRSEVGARLDQVLEYADGTALKLRGRAAWLHDYSDDPVMGAAFSVLPGAAFSVTGATAARDALLASAAAELQLASGLSLIARFDGEFAESAQAYAGTATLRRVW